MTAPRTSTSTWPQNNGGPFDPAAYGGDEATALAVRQAFLKTIPRQEIVDRLIVPLNPNATVRNSFTQVPGSAGYDAIAATNGLSAYDEVDIAGAQALLEEAGVTTPVQVRFHYAANNPRRASEYELIRDSAAQAGFEVLDGNSPDVERRAAEHGHLRRRPVRLDLDDHGTAQLGGELRHRRGEQLLRLLQRGSRRRVAGNPGDHR